MTPFFLSVHGAPVPGYISILKYYFQIVKTVQNFFWSWPCTFTVFLNFFDELLSHINMLKSMTIFYFSLFASKRNCDPYCSSLFSRDFVIFVDKQKIIKTFSCNFLKNIFTFIFLPLKLNEKINLLYIY